MPIYLAGGSFNKDEERQGRPQDPGGSVPIAGNYADFVCLKASYSTVRIHYIIYFSRLGHLDCRSLIRIYNQKFD